MLGKAGRYMSIAIGGKAVRAPSTRTMRQGAEVGLKGGGGGGGDSATDIR